MPAGLTAEAFAKLLAYLDADREQAGEKYEELRRKLIRFFEWRGAAFPEEHADETLNRLAKKIAEGIVINNVGSYCHEIARLVRLEALKGHDSRRTSLEDKNFEVAAASGDEASEKENRLACLDECLGALPPDSRELIVEYYRDAGADRIERRRVLAARLGLQREALANRAQRLRDKLAQCVTRCLAKNTTI
jgi:DNA-directed RNA polymerase specialized sigma24 family protein